MAGLGRGLYLEPAEENGRFFGVAGGVTRATLSPHFKKNNPQAPQRLVDGLTKFPTGFELNPAVYVLFWFHGRSLLSAESHISSASPAVS